MTKEEIITKVKNLNLPKDSYIVFGSCPLTIHGIREARDIDLLVSKEILIKLKKIGWQKLNKGLNDKPFVYDVFEAHDNWDFSSYSPTLKHLLLGAEMVENIPFASLEEVRKWKLAWGRKQDLADVSLIDKYFLKSVKESL